MSRTLPLLATVVIVALLAACAGNLGQDADTGFMEITLTAGQRSTVGAQGVPTDQDGLRAVELFEITVYDRNGDLVSFDAGNTFDPEGSSTIVVLGAGETSVTIRLPSGKYTFKTRGLESAAGVLLAYGETKSDVTHETTSLQLDVHSLLGQAELKPEGLRHYIVPGETLDLYLYVRTDGGTYRVPLGDYTVEYRLEDGLGDLTGSTVGARILVTPTPTKDHFKVSVKVIGWGLKDGEPASKQRITATFERPFLQTTGVSVDTERPTVTFDPPGTIGLGQSATLTGTANDGVGIAKLQVFEGPVLIGSTATEDVDNGAARITFTDTTTGAWTMEWQPPIGAGLTTYQLTAVAIDTSGNDGMAEAELTVGAVAPPPASIGGLQSLGADEPLDETSGNCAANELGLPGQGLQAVGAGLQAVGAVGGLFLGPVADFAGRTVSPSTVAAEVHSLANYSYYHDRVAILLVDEFGGTYDLPAELLAGGALTEAELQALAASGELMHGALVLHQLLALIEGAGFGTPTASTNGTTGEPLYLFESTYGNELAVQTVDTAGRDTAEIVATIRSSFDYISKVGELHYADFVVNMSFAVVPCAVAADLGASSVDTFEEYVTALRLLNGIGAQYEAELTELLTTPLGAGDDPLLAYLDCPLPVIKHGARRCDGYVHGDGPVVKSLVHVASSGNLGHDFALYPAAWPTVISVSSQDVESGGYSALRSTFANSGEVLAPGALYELTSTAGVQTIAYAGTSFSAPVVTLFTALDRLGDRLCSPGDLEGTSASAPDLAYGAFDDVPLDTVFGGAGSAIDLYCGAE